MKKFVLKFVLFTFLVALIIIPVNVIIDPYNIFHVNNIRDNGIEPNKNYIKTKYVIENPDKFDSYLFGSSRVGFLDVTRMTGGTYYNMMYSEGLPLEHLHTLKWMISEGEIPRNVIIGVDDISCFVDGELHDEQMYRMEYPYDGSIVDKAGFYLKYMDIITTLESLPTMKEHGAADPEAAERYYTTGTEKLDLPAVFPVESENTPYWSDYYSLRTDEVLEELAQIKELCDAYDINLIVFTNPLHALTYQKDLENGYMEFLHRLTEVTPYYNFSGFNDITCDNFYYYETSHYSRDAGNLMINAIFKGEVSEELLSQGFGVYVTEENVDEHISLLVEQAKERGINVLGYQ